MQSQAPRHIKSIVGRNLKAARAAAGLTQRELAYRLDTDPMSVSRWETGRVMPGWARLAALCDALDVAVDWLLTDHEERAA